MAKGTCSVDGCNKFGIIVRGLCTMHYKRLRTRGEIGGPLPETRLMKGKPTEERFWANVEKTETCWNWIGGDNGVGYGVFFYDGRRGYAHRFSYEFHVGEIPPGLHIDHLCRNTRCVNPEHLEAVTQRENTLRGETPWARVVRTGRCQRGHAYDEANTWFDKFGKRHCRHCHRDNARARYRRIHGLPA